MWRKGTVVLKCNSIKLFGGKTFQSETGNKVMTKLKSTKIKEFILN